MEGDYFYRKNRTEVANIDYTKCRPSVLLHHQI